MPEFLAFTIVGLVIILMSWLIKYKKTAHLISGYDENEVSDKDGLCNWMGGMLMWQGVYAIITGEVMWKYPTVALPVGFSFVAFTAIITIIAIAGAKKYNKDWD